MADDNTSQSNSGSVALGLGVGAAGGAAVGNRIENKTWSWKQDEILKARAAAAAEKGADAAKAATAATSTASASTVAKPTKSVTAFESVYPENFDHLVNVHLDGKASAYAEEQLKEMAGKDEDLRKLITDAEKRKEKIAELKEAYLRNDVAEGKATRAEAEKAFRDLHGPRHEQVRAEFNALHDEVGKAASQTTKPAAASATQLGSSASAIADRRKSIESLVKLRKGVEDLEAKVDVLSHNPNAEGAVLPEAQKEFFEKGVQHLSESERAIVKANLESQIHNARDAYHNAMAAHIDRFPTEKGLQNGVKGIAADIKKLGKAINAAPSHVNSGTAGEVADAIAKVGWKGRVGGAVAGAAALGWVAHELTKSSAPNTQQRS